MDRRRFIGLALAGGALASCGVPESGGRTQAPIAVTRYGTSQAEEQAVQFRVAESVNTYRSARGLAPLRLNPQLVAAAKTHAIDMARQNRAWHFGSDGSSPVTRVQRAGYRGVLGGEVISETYENDIQTVREWMLDEGTREVLMDARAREMGAAYFQQPDGKLWWSLVTAYPPGA